MPAAHAEPRQGVQVLSCVSVGSSMGTAEVLGASLCARCTFPLASPQPSRGTRRWQKGWWLKQRGGKCLGVQQMADPAFPCQLHRPKPCCWRQSRR